MKNVLVILASLMLGACAFTPQTADLNPTLHLTQSNIGKGTEISVRVVDERTQKILGHRGSAFMKGAKITTDQDIPGLFHGKIMEALAAQGFAPVAYDEERPLQLRVDIRNLEYYTSTGFWSGGIHTNAAVKATATLTSSLVSVKGSKKFEKVYISEGEKRVLFVPGAGSNERELNSAIAGVLEKMVGDQELLSFLVRSGAAILSQISTAAGGQADAMEVATGEAEADEMDVAATEAEGEK